MTTDPIHLAIIPDGNRRWAKERTLLPWKGHEKSAENFEDLSNWCREDPRIAVFSIWVFSTENWQRDPKEVQKLMEMFEHYLRDRRDVFHKNQTRLRHAGRSDRLNDGLKEILTELIEETKGYEEFTLNLALDYGGHDELNRAAEKFAQSTAAEADLGMFLDNPDLPPVDLVVRTSGEQRTSGLFPWQSTYAEWMFPDLYFPDFTPDHLAEAMEEFEGRKRRFGK